MQWVWAPSAPIIFSAGGDAIEWIVRQRRVELIFHYDNIIVVGEARSNKCSQGLAILLQTCEDVGAQMSVKDQRLASLFLA